MAIDWYFFQYPKSSPPQHHRYYCRSNVVPSMFSIAELTHRVCREFFFIMELLQTHS